MSLCGAAPVSFRYNLQFINYCKLMNFKHASLYGSWLLTPTPQWCQKSIMGVTAGRLWSQVWQHRLAFSATSRLLFSKTKQLQINLSEQIYVIFIFISGQTCPRGTVPCHFKLYLLSVAFNFFSIVFTWVVTSFLLINSAQSFGSLSNIPRAKDTFKDQQCNIGA